MATLFLGRLLKKTSVPSLLHFSSIRSNSFTRPISRYILPPPQYFPNPNQWGLRNFSHGHVNLVISQGKPKFEIHEIEPPKKEKWKTKKRLKMQRKREKQKRKSFNKRDPRHLGIKGKKKKQKFPNVEDRIKNKIEKAKIKEALLIERLKRYEVSKLQGPMVEQETLTGEERFYMKKMAQKRSNYVQVGRRGLFGGVVLNMHLHWKKHETVKVICKPCKPGQVHEYAKEIARLSGGIPIQVIGDDTIIFYRGKNYVQPEVMLPIDTLSKKRALEKSKFEQSLESVRRFIAMAEKELELYYRHVALYGDPNNRSSDSNCTTAMKGYIKPENFATDKGSLNSNSDDSSTELSETDFDLTAEDEDLSGSEIDSDIGNLSGSYVDFEDEEDSNFHESSTSRLDLSFREGDRFDFDGTDLPVVKSMNLEH